MKKILSVLAISTLVFGSAAAKKSVNLNYRNGASLFSFANNGESDDRNFGTSAEQYASLFDLNKHQGGNDALNLKASGDVLSFETQVNPSIQGWSKNSMNRIKIGANFGAFGILAGFNCDGEAVGSFRVKKDADACNWDGSLFETFKPGSIFKDSYAAYSINQTNIGAGGATGIQQREKGLNLQSSELFLQLAFNLAIPNSDASFKLLGTIISDRAWKGSSNDGAKQKSNGADVVTGDTEEGEWLGAANSKYNDGHLAYTVFAIFSKPSVFNAMAFIKMNPHCLGCDIDQVFVPGAYVEVMAIKNLDIMGGFTMSIVEGTYEDYAFDLRARYAVNSALSITYFGNISVLNGDVSTSHDISKEVGTYSYAYANSYDYATSPAGTYVYKSVQTLASQIFMWNHLNVRFALTDSIVPQLGIGAITDLANGINVGPQKGEGTELSITPACQFFASKNASINVGVNVTFRGIGKEEHPVARTSYGNTKTTGDTTATQQGLDVGFSIPVLFRVKM
jgi:hypothetical protein